MKLISIAFVFISVLVSNCKKDVQSSDIIKIEFGTSFGMCVGYCTQILEISEGEALKSVIPRVNTNLKVKSCERSFEEFTNIASKIDIEAFTALTEIIGCPDCADGGSEWIEIVTQEGSKKVTYEYGKEPAAVKSIIRDLRNLHAELGECDQ